MFLHRPLITLLLIHFPLIVLEIQPAYGGLGAFGPNYNIQLLEPFGPLQLYVVISL